MLMKIMEFYYNYRRLSKYICKNSYLKFEYIQKNEDLLTNAGNLLGFDQICISEEYSIPDVPKESMATVSISESRRDYTITGENFVYQFSKKKGCFTSMSNRGEEILHAPMEFNVFRAPIDNDKNIIKEWEKAGYDRAVARVYETTAVYGEKEVVIKYRMSMAAVYRPNLLEYEMSWRVLGDGSIHVRMQGERNVHLPYLPRLGLKLALPKTYQNVEYFGYGPQESYCDKHRAAYVDRFEATVEELITCTVEWVPIAVDRN